jgi:DNA repair protein RecO (recombination protein O)
MRRRISLEPAFVLRSQTYRDTSLLLEVFTPAHGRVGLVARGVRGPRSRSRALLQLLQPLLLSWVEGGDLGTLTASEAQAPAIALQGDRVFYAWYLNELLLRLLQRHDPHPALYARYAGALDRLGGAAAEAALRVFEKHLLAEIGYGMALPAGLEPQQRYRLSETGAVVPDAAGLLGRSLIALRDEDGFDAETLRETRQLLAARIARLLGGQMLETPRLLRALRARSNEAAGRGPDTGAQAEDC